MTSESKRDLVALGGGKQLDFAADFAGALARALDHAVDLIVGVGWLMMEQGDASGAGFDSHVGHVVDTAVAPAATFDVLLRRVLRILDEQIDAPHKVDEPPVATMQERAACPAAVWSIRRRVGADQSVRLVIGDV